MCGPGVTHRPHDGPRRSTGIVTLGDAIRLVLLEAARHVYLSVEHGGAAVYVTVEHVGKTTEGAFLEVERDDLLRVLPDDVEDVVDDDDLSELQEEEVLYLSMAYIQQPVQFSTIKTVITTHCN